MGVQADYPQFGEVVEVYVVGTNWVILHTRILETIEHAHHYHAYVISRTTEFKLLTPDDLYTHSLLHLRHLRADSHTKLVVIPKYAIPCRPL